MSKRTAPPRSAEEWNGGLTINVPLEPRSIRAAQCDRDNSVYANAEVGEMFDQPNPPRSCPEVAGSLALALGSAWRSDQAIVRPSAPACVLLKSIDGSP